MQPLVEIPVRYALFTWFLMSSDLEMKTC